VYVGLVGRLRQPVLKVAEILDVQRLERVCLETLPPTGIPRNRSSDLVLSNGYVRKLLGNARVAPPQHYRDILAEFQKLAETETAPTLRRSQTTLHLLKSFRRSASGSPYVQLSG
jgi:hypothetical protein